MVIRERPALLRLRMLGFCALAVSGTLALTLAQEAATSTQVRFLIDASRFEEAEEVGRRLIITATARAGARGAESNSSN